MMAKNTPKSITESITPQHRPLPKEGSVSDYKPKMNITLDGSTYTKTIDFGSQDFYNESNADVPASSANGFILTQVNQPSVLKNCLNVQRLTSCNEISNSSISEKIMPLDVHNDPSTTPSRKIRLRSTFFSRLVRRLTIRRPSAKLTSESTPGDFNSESFDKKSSQIPTARKIRRWLSKYWVSPSKNSPLKSPPATLDYPIDKCVSQLANDVGSLPTRRRGLPIPNTSESSPCNSQTGTISLVDEPVKVIEGGIRQCSRLYATGRLNSENAGLVVSITTKQGNPASQLFSAFSSPSVVAIGPPPRYLNVSLAAFGYTGCNQKWFSAQTLQHDNTSAAVDQELASTFPQASVTPRRRKSTSLAVSPSHTPVQRPHCLDLHDGHEPQNYSNSTGIEGDKWQEHNRSNHSHHENWNRSSLVMLAVAQASPRSHNAPSSNAISATTSATDRQSFFLTDSAGGPSTSPTKAFHGRRLVSAEESSSLDVPLPKVEEVTFSDATWEKGLIVSMTNLEEANSPTNLINGRALGQSKINSTDSEQVKDGHYFLRVAECIAQELRSRADAIEHDLNENELPEDVSGHLRTTMGKVNLLLSKKFAQFRGLCIDSIKAMEAADFAGDFITLPSDLEGFWAMVMLQVNDVRSTIAICDRLKQNGWQSAPDSSIYNGQNSCPSIVSKCPFLSDLFTLFSSLGRKNGEFVKITYGQGRHFVSEGPHSLA